MSTEETKKTKRRCQQWAARRVGQGSFNNVELFLHACTGMHIVIRNAREKEHRGSSMLGLRDVGGCAGNAGNSRRYRRNYFLERGSSPSLRVLTDGKVEVKRSIQNDKKESVGVAG